MMVAERYNRTAHIHTVFDQCSGLYVFRSLGVGGVSYVTIGPSLDGSGMFGEGGTHTHTIVAARADCRTYKHRLALWDLCPSCPLGSTIVTVEDVARIV